MTWVPPEGFSVHYDADELLQFGREVVVGHEDFRNRMQQDVTRTAIKVQEVAMQNAPVFMGILVNSITTVPAKHFDMGAESHTTAYVTVIPEMYSMVQEVERRPQQPGPPMDVMIRYVHLKVNRGELQLQPQEYPGEPFERRVVRTAYVLSRHIAHYGTPGHEYMWKGKLAGEELLPTLLIQTIDDLLRDLATRG